MVYGYVIILRDYGDHIASNYLLWAVTRKHGAIKGFLTFEMLDINNFEAKESTKTQAPSGPPDR